MGPKNANRFSDKFDTIKKHAGAETFQYEHSPHRASGWGGKFTSIVV
jgi:hypothetical protein